MTEPLTLTTERIDDMPLGLAHLARMGLQPLWDAHVPTHGNWVGLSPGGGACSGGPISSPRATIGSTTSPPGPHSGCTRGGTAPSASCTP